MKIIQSFWSKPAFHSVQEYNNARRFGGWLNFKYFLISSALSCLTIRRHHKKIYLYTDDDGKGLLIDMLQLPYDDVSLALNDLNDEDHRLWIRGKMIAIKDQQGPFIHVDNDIYLWEALPDSTRPDFLVAQSRFPIWLQYKSSLNEIFANFSYIPECLAERPTGSTMVANVGIVGGNDMDFFREFCAISHNLLENNRQHLSVVDIGGFNQMMEEYLYTSLARYKKREMTYLLETRATGFPVSHIDFSLVPAVYKYIHLIGHNKQDPYACEQLELRLKYEFPDYYSKVVSVMNQLQPDSNTGTFTERQHRLTKSLDVLYRSDLQSLEKKKIRLAPNIEILRVCEYLGDNVSHVVKETDPRDGSITYKSLWGQAGGAADYWLKFFGRPTSIAEIMEQVREDHKNKSEAELEAVRVRIISAIATNLFQVGTMEFA